MTNQPARPWLPNRDEPIARMEHMPGQHLAPSTLSWSAHQQIYELSAPRHPEMLRLAGETPAWFAWLEEVSAFAFHGQRGSFTARKETKQRGSGYWYAYRKRGRALAKKYLGKTADLTFARLEEVAALLHAESPAPAGTPESLPGLPAQHETVRASAHTDASRGGSSSALTADARPTMQESSPAPLLATKLHQPRPRARLVPRSHLVERLQQGVAGALTLLSAPAGYGKTTLLAQWRASTRAPVAWLSLEPEDNEPTRFLTYLIAALQTLDPRLGTRAQALLGFLQPAEPETVLSLLANDLIDWQEEDFALVLDDYHVITVAPIHRALTHLVEHLPPQMHLIIATRSDPPLPLARLRAGGQLTELRAAEFCLGAAEAGAFLAEVMGLHLSPEEVTTLQSRTEGWIAGLQLAALSLQGRADIASALTAFSGTHRFVLDYLSEEVLSRQDASVQAFLLQTSVLERLSGPLCEAVTGQKESQALLEALERANLFVAALDDVRGWYRYHQLFADLLRSRLSQAMPTLVPELHRRASTWYEEQGLILDAVHHAVLAADLERVSRLLEEHRHSLALGGQARTVLALLDALPDELIKRNPGLCFSQALLLMLTGQLPEALTRLQVVEQAASRLTSRNEAQDLRYQVAALQAYILFYQGDLESSVALAEQALDHLATCPVEVQEAARVIAAHRVVLSGDVSRVGEQHLARLASGSASGSDASAMELILHLISILLHARLLRLQGRLRQAAAVYEQVEQRLGEHEGALVYPGACFGLGELCYEWNDLEAAERLLEQGREALHGPLPLEASAIARGYATLARLHQARHNNTGALATVEEFVRLTETRQFAPAQLAAARAMHARLALMQGDLAAAVRWADASGFSDPDDPCYPREWQYLIFVRVRIAQGRLDPTGPYLAEALRLLEHLRADVERSVRLGSLLEILVLQSLALFADSAQRRHALVALERALQLARQGEYIRLFVDEGQPMVTLLRQVYAHRIAPEYVSTLLAAFGERAQAAPSHAFPLVEPLTERELAVLRLLVRGLSNAEIARELIITVGTVKRHVNSIYGKLGVKSRAQAVVRTQTLHLL